MLSPGTFKMVLRYPEDSFSSNTLERRHNRGEWPEHKHYITAQSTVKQQGYTTMNTLCWSNRTSQTENTCLSFQGRPSLSPSWEAATIPTNPASLTHATVPIKHSVLPVRALFLLRVLYTNYAIPASNEKDLHYTPEHISKTTASMHEHFACAN